MSQISILLCLPLAAPEKFMGVFRYLCTVFIILIFRYIMRINIRIRGNNRDFQFCFFTNLPNNNVGGSVNQYIMKKASLPMLLMLSLHFVEGAHTVKEKN